MKILVINGPNLDMLGKREEIYGTLSLKEINMNLKKIAKNHYIKFYQSNYEGKIVKKIHKSLYFDAIIINAAAYTHTSIAILDALKMFKGVILEVHLTDIEIREDFRKTNYISYVSHKSFCGKKEISYYEALRYLLDNNNLLK